MALVVLNVAATAALGVYAYRVSRDSLEAEAARAVSVAAAAREQGFVRTLNQRLARMRSFLASVESLCGERKPRGGFAYEPECVRVALGGFRTSEQALGADLYYGERRLVSRGTRVQTSELPGPDVLAAIASTAGGGEYVMRARRGRLSVAARYPLDDINAIFQDRSGLEDHGEVWLAGDDGVPLTPVQRPDGQTLAADATPQPCGGAAPSTHIIDVAGLRTITALQPAPAIAGGCIVASLPYEDVVGPIHRLGRLFATAAGALVIGGIFLSIIIARAATKPLARLAAAARTFEQGQFGGQVPIGGPTEVRQLGRALSSMALAIGNLVTQEQRARLDAEAANRTKDNFLAMLSHELRTPLNAILGWTSIMRHRASDETMVGRAVATIERSARTQARLVDELLDVSRIAAGKFRLDAVTNVPMRSIVQSALDAAGPAADAKQLSVVARFDPQVTTVWGDAGRLQQVVANLMSNAVRFTPEGGRIDVSLAREGTATVVRVSDNGAGIAPQFLPFVFERFRQEDSSTTRRHGGLGLGLAIVQHLVQLHGGSVRAESGGLGLGATFIVTLPDRPAGEQGSSVQPAAEPRTAILEGMRVLVVDDDPDTRDVVRRMLEEAGAVVVTSASATETRAVLEATAPDLLIADIGMPVEDGYALIRSVRALDSEALAHVPAIALTAHARPEDVEQAIASGFQMHLAKPVDSSQLLTAVTTTLVNTWAN